MTSCAQTMRSTVTRWGRVGLFIAVIGLMLAGCGNDTGDAGLTQQGQTSLAGIPATFAPYGTLSEAEDAVREAVEAGCRRFFNDCKYLCDSPFVTCPATMSDCITDNIRNYTEDYDFPYASAELGRVCAAQVRVASCDDIPPDSLECDDVVVEGCPEDPDGVANYSWASPRPVTLGQPVSLELCDGVHEWHSFSASSGQVLELDGTQDGTDYRITLFKLTDNAAGQAFLIELGEWDEGDMPVLWELTSDGPHLLEVRGIFEPRVRMELTVDLSGGVTEVPPAPEER